MATLFECRRRHDAADDFIRSIYTNKTAWSARQSALQQKIKCAYATLADDAEAYGAWESLLGRLRYTTALVSIAPGIPALGPQAGNTFLDALLQCALRQADWTRPLDDWTPSTGEPPSLQFQRLLHHLFCRYPVPEFFDKAWFEGFSEVGEAHRDWFLLVGSGQNIRRATLPVRLTEKMAHYMLLAPAESSIVTALRYGQALGLGGTPELAQALAQSRLSDLLPDEPFWESAIHFFVNYAGERLAQVAPMVDFLFAQKYGETLQYLPDGTVDTGDAPDPAISMKGRKWDALKSRVEEWHTQLARDAQRPRSVWAPSGIGAFSVEEPDPNGIVCHWTITELLNTNALLLEGREQRHCVFSYANACKNGGTSIWSLRVRSKDASGSKRLLTIEVNNGRRAIVQVRGRCNLAPAQYRGNGRMQTARRQLKQWAQQERLSIACGC